MANYTWRLANPYSIARDPSQNAWSAGRTRDLLVIGPSEAGERRAFGQDDLPLWPVLVATSTGGLWQIGGSGASNVSDDLDHANFECLATGYQGAGHYFAGGQGCLYETDHTAPDPLRSWRRVQLPPYYDTQTVLGIECFDDPGRVVIELGAGWLFWGSPMAPGVYDWHIARDEAGKRASCSGLARAQPTYLGFPWRHAIATFLESPYNMPGFGVFESNELVIHAGSWIVPNASPLGPLHGARLGSSERHRTRVYAMFGEMEILLRSTDGGVSWSRALLKLGGAPPGVDIKTFALGGSPSPGGGPRKIGVSPELETVLAFGATRPLVSGDGGDSFVPLGGWWDAAGNYVQTTPHLHADVNALRFDSTDPLGRRLFILTDGGISMVTDWTSTGVDWRSDYNKHLTNLEFAGRADTGEYPLEYSGSLGCSYVARDSSSKLAKNFSDLIAAGGLQDNGNVLAKLDPVEPWCQFAGGDGGFNDFVNIDRPKGFRKLRGQPTSSIGALLLDTTFGGTRWHPVEALRWDFTSTVGLGPIPAPGADGVGAAVRFAAVSRPDRVGDTGEYVLAVAVQTTEDDYCEVYGLFLDVLGDIGWRLLWRSREKAFGSCVASWDGLATFVGTNGFGAKGRMFVIDTLAAIEGRNPALELSVNLPKGRPQRIQIGWASSYVGYATWAGAGRWTQLLRLDSLTWNPLTVPQDLFDGLAMFNERLATHVFLAGARRVYASEDDGSSWADISNGLPRAIHCTDLRALRDPRTSNRTLLLSSYGRSIWRADLDSSGSADDRQDH